MYKYHGVARQKTRWTDGISTKLLNRKKQDRKGWRTNEEALLLGMDDQKKRKIKTTNNETLINVI